jgi:p-aminobenzoyl-glutamate transporter AbgT
MENYSKGLVCALIFFAIMGGQVVYGLATGQIHQRYGVIKRDKDPVFFWVMLFIYLVFATAMALGAIDLILRINNRPGLW